MYPGKSLSAMFGTVKGAQSQCHHGVGLMGKGFVSCPVNC